MAASIDLTGSIQVRMVEGTTRVLTIDNSPNNRLHPPLMAELQDAIESADADSGVTGIVLTGAGAVFCGGLDLPALRAGADPAEFAGALVALLRVFPELGTPIVAVVNGDALAAGASLVAACDVAMAVPEARIGTYEVSVGVWPMIAQVPLIHRIGARAAMENVGAGEPFTAQRAYELGLVQRVAPLAEAEDAARGWLSNAARAHSAAAGRRSLYELAELPYDVALESALSRFVAQFEKPS